MTLDLLSAVSVDQPRHASGWFMGASWYMDAMDRLVKVVRELSQARDLNTVTQIVREAARSLTMADGSTFVLRDCDQCYYADEDAIEPLWKGRRFPMKDCISGWVMLQARPVIIEDIYQDPRIPVEAYRPTFVKSLAMVPIRRNAPIGAIGNYWATTHHPSDQEMSVLQALADSTSMALENIELHEQVEHKVKILDAQQELIKRHNQHNYRMTIAHGYMDRPKTAQT